MVKPKPEDKGSMRTPGPKKKLGLTVPPALRMPHEDLITRQITADEEETPSMPSQTSQPSRTSLTRHTPRDSSRESLPEENPVAPQRDYTKTANSIVREAVPGGLFKGKSKQIYDCLYSMTRGAIVPTRRVRISRPKLMAKAHIGSRVTFDANVLHLKSIGLIRVINITGEHEGNEYEVMLPEEVSMTSLTSLTSLTGYAQKLDRLVCLETSQTRHTLSPEESTTSDLSKTFFKTKERNFDDDAALAGLVRALKEAAKGITGTEISVSETDRWTELGELLAAELQIAAARTGSISSVGAFLATHLRRRLWKKEKADLAAESPVEMAAQQSLTPITPEQISKCPDCGGSGMYYPEGYEKGVARCRHEKLTTES